MKSKLGKPFSIILIAIFAALSFRAPSAYAQSDRIVFAVIGDYGLAGQPTADVAALVKSWNPDFIVTTGDNNQNDRPYEMDDNIGQYYHEYLVNYKGKYGAGSPTRRFYPTPGNHDWAGDGLKSYLDYFDLKKHQRYYEFTQGPIHFFMLDSDRNEPDGVDEKSEQAIWLKKALKASTSPFNVVVFHHPPYTSGKHRGTEYMRWPFKEWGADVVLSGHNHLYERLNVNGLPYLINGLGGAEIYKFETVIPESQVRYNLDYGAMRVEATNAYMKFQMITRAGILVDEYIIGGSAPVVSSILRNDPSPTNAGQVNFQITFSDPVTGVDASDFLLNTNIPNAGIIDVTGTGNAYTVSVNTGNGDGTLRLDLIDNDSILSSLSLPLGGNGAANGNFATGDTYSIDKTTPTITNIMRASTNPTNAAAVDFAVIFSEPVTGVDAGDFAVVSNTGANIASVSGLGANYTVSVSTGSGNDDVRIDFLANNSVSDLAGNVTSAGFTAGESYAVDRQAPIVTAITRVNTANASSVDYAIRFSEPVLGVDGSDFILSTINGALITNITGAGDLYTVSVSIQPGSDSIRLDLNNNGSITDALGNLLNGNFLGEIVNIAIDTPILTSMIRASANPTNAARVDFIVTFSEPVSGVDASDFALTNAAGIININNANPFYIITVGTGTKDGELKLELYDNDSIQNAQGIPLGGIGAGRFSGETYSIDRTAPQVTSIIRAGNSPTSNPTADFIVTFSEPVNNVDANDFILTQTNVIKSAILGIQNADPFYVITVSTGAGSGALRLDLATNADITDRAGNALANAGFTSGEIFSIAKTTVDFAAPNITEPRVKLTQHSSPLVAWSSVWDAQAYEVFIARDANFAQLVSAQITTNTSLAQSLPDGAYYIRVRAYNKDLYPGKFSATLTLTVDSTPPPAPAPVSPLQNATTPKRPWLKWSTVSGGAEYQLEVDNNADFSSPEFKATTHKNTIQTKVLTKKTIYYWRIRAKDAAGNWSAWSIVSGFYVP
ncbi:MAG: metallophosphoesterase [Chloroflexi bacterium]|nr:metallophosphoesterase [Chloroflexota bacterium]